MITQILFLQVHLEPQIQRKTPSLIVQVDRAEMKRKYMHNFLHTNKWILLHFKI